MRIVVGLVVVAVTFAAAWIVSSRGLRNKRATMRSAAHPIATEVYREPPAAVGWVFGRVVGVQGAHQPLMSGSSPAMPPGVRQAAGSPGTVR